MKEIKFAIILLCIFSAIAVTKNNVPSNRYTMTTTPVTTQSFAN